MSLDEIREASLADPTLQSANDDALRPYRNIISELSTCDGIVIPPSLQQRVVDSAHEGIVKSKALIRSKVYFARIDQMADNTVKQYRLPS